MDARDKLLFGGASGVGCEVFMLVWRVCGSE